MADNVIIEKIGGTRHTFNFNFSKYEDYQKMTADLKDLEEMLEDIPESKQEKSLLQAKEKNEQERATIDQNLQNNANEFLLKAQLRATQFDENRMPETIALYEQALVSYRSAENLFAYAYFLQEQNQFKEATAHYQEALGIYRKLALPNPEVYLPYVATTLNNLAVLLYSQGQLAEAKAMYEECLGIRVRLYEQNKAAYAPALAEISANYAIFYLQAKGYQDKDASIQLCQQCILVGS